MSPKNILKSTKILFGILFGNYALSGAIAALMVIPNILVTTFSASYARKKGLRSAYVLALQIGIVAMVAMAVLLYFGQPGSVHLKSMSLYAVLFLVLYAIGRYFSTTPSSLVLTMGADISDCVSPYRYSASDADS